jgi:invasion protein IalB
MKFDSLTIAASVLTALGLGAGAVQAAEQKPALIGDFRDWHVYRMGAGANRLCYALSEPKQMSPAGANRDQVSFLISTWPGRNVHNEPSVVPGYPYRVGSKVQVQVGNARFDFFTRNEGDNGGAWAQIAADEPKLIAALKKGSTMTVTGTSQRGTLTRDNYSLSGISAALDKLQAECK